MDLGKRQVRDRTQSFQCFKLIHSAWLSSRNVWFYLTIRLFALDFYEVIVDEAEGRINYRLIEIESE